MDNKNKQIIKKIIYLLVFRIHIYFSFLFFYFCRKPTGSLVQIHVLLPVNIYIVIYCI